MTAGTHLIVYSQAMKPADNLGDPHHFPSKATFLFCFPYNTSGSALEPYMDDASLILLKFPDFLDYVLPENTFRERGCSKHRVGQLTSLNVILSVLTLTVLNTYK
jgi:hypothetical protein